MKTLARAQRSPEPMERVPDGFRLFELQADDFLHRLVDLELVITTAFKDADFMEKRFCPASPWLHTREGLLGPDREVFRHVVVEDGKDRIIAAAFRVPVSQRTIDEDADPGWFFVATEVPRHHRIAVAGAMITRAHRMMRNAGFAAVVTEMGTRSGAHLLSKHYGYAHAPIPGAENRWMHIL